eukprot:122568-Prorocentrum_minimum.AAC.2
MPLKRNMSRCSPAGPRSRPRVPEPFGGGGAVGLFRKRRLPSRLALHIHIRSFARALCCMLPASYASG